MSMTQTLPHAIYGRPPAELAPVPEGALQLSPLVPGSEDEPGFEELPPDSLASVTMLAPPGTIERRSALALALRSLPAGAPLTVLAPKTKGGSRLRADLEGFGCVPRETSRAHHRICVVARPEMPVGLADAIAAGAPRRLPELAPPDGLWTQPGLFSWDRVDPGSALLAAHVGGLSGRGADLGCGAGYLARAVLAGPKVTALALVDIDRRAVGCARRNVVDPRANYLWADARLPNPALAELNFVVMNPPFHDNGQEDQSLGQTFVRAAAAALRRGGHLWLVANRHLPYEKSLRELFVHVAPAIEAGGYKVYEARK